MLQSRKHAKIARVFRSHAEAEKSDREFHRSLTPAQRLDILLTLIARGNITKSDETGPGLKRVYRLLNARNVRYLVVGAYALAFHGRPRYTGDIDFFVQPSAQNAELVAKIIEEFGFASLGIVAADLSIDDQVIQLGVEPNRIDLMTSISDVSFEEAWNTREYGEIVV